jgi:nitrite reductase (NADH) small subunit
MWNPICPLEDIVPNTGICALLGGQAIAVFRWGDSEQVFALSNHDPHSEASVLSRGLIGNLGAAKVVASPIYKQHFNLETGECLEDASTPIPHYPARVVGGVVEVQYG